MTEAPKKPSEILDAAADTIVRDGWLQGMYYQTPEWGEGFTEEQNHEADLAANRTAPCCQDGAISRAAFGLAWTPSESYRDRNARIGFSEAREYMRRHVKAMGNSSPVAWNDDPERTKEEVIAALRGAANLARAEGK